MSTFLDIISIILGWTYFSLWTASFYFMSYELYKLKDVSGFSIDFLVLNIVGYICYSINNLSGYLDANSPVGTTHLADVIFALHGFVFCLFQLYQFKIYRDNKDPNQSLSMKVVINHICLFCLCCLIFILQSIGIIDPHSKYISLLIFFGYIKVYITLLKYTPQIYLHFKRKLTIGWNVNVSWSDFFGGLFSLLQILVDCINSGNWNIFENNSTPLNIAKFSLGFVTIVYDTILLFQHYILYRTNNQNELIRIKQLQEREDEQGWDQDYRKDNTTEIEQQIDHKVFIDESQQDQTQEINPNPQKYRSINKSDRDT